MQIVIDIPHFIYEQILKGHISKKTIAKIFSNGTPLPKGHGRLKDIDWIDDNCPDYRTEDGAWCYKWEDIDNATSIIEADKGEE